MRTSGDDSASAGFPITRATAPSDLSLDSKPKIRKLPKAVGKAASATLTVFMGGSIARGFFSFTRGREDRQQYRVGRPGRANEIGSSDLPMRARWAGPRHRT